MNWGHWVIVAVVVGVWLVGMLVIDARLRSMIPKPPPPPPRLHPRPDERPADLHPRVGWPPNRPPAPKAPDLTFYAITTNGSVAEVSMNLHRARARAIELQYRGEGTVRLLELQATRAIDFMPGERE